MGRSKVMMAWSILYLLASIFLIAVGTYPVIYIYFIHEVPTGPSEPVTTAESLTFMGILIALGCTALRGIIGTVMAIRQLIRKEEQHE